MKPHIETIVLKDCVIGKTQYKKDDIFIYDCTNLIQEKFKTGKYFKILEPNKYDYYCNFVKLNIFDKEYKKDDLIENALEIPTLKSLVEVGKIRKEIKEKFKPDFSYVSYKELSLQHNCSWDNFKIILENLNINCEHHLKQIQSDDLEKIESYFKTLEL